MAGIEGNIKPMWKKIGNHIKLEEAEPFHGNVYLGCVQRDVEPDMELINEKKASMKSLLRLQTKVDTNIESNVLRLSDFEEQRRATDAASKPRIKQFVYDMIGHADNGLCNIQERSGSSHAVET